MYSVRAMELRDVPLIVDYFCRGTVDFYIAMGTDPKKVPTPEAYHAHLASLIGVPAEKAKTFYSIWLLNGEPIGHSSLKDIVFGEFGSQHLHIWKPLERGKGAGGRLFCQSTLDFYERFQPKKIICEPKAANPLPNRMLQKIGFPLLGSRVAASSEIALVCELNTYNVQRALAERYLTGK